MYQLLEKGVIINDSTSSIQVPPGYIVTIGEHNFTGKVTIFKPNTPFVGDDYNDLISSITVAFDQQQLWKQMLYRKSEMKNNIKLLKKSERKRKLNQLKRSIRKKTTKLPRKSERKKYVKLH
jgi:hypothetical protein